MKELQHTLDLKRILLQEGQRRGLDDVAVNADTNFSCGTQHMLAWKIGEAAKCACYLGATFVRVEGDLERGVECFRQNSQLPPLLAGVLQRLDREVPLSSPPKHNENLSARDLEWFMVGVLMAADPATTRSAARLFSHARIVAREEFPYEPFLAFCIQGDLEQARWLASCKPDIPLQQTLSPLMRAIVEQDGQIFAEALRDREVAFRARSRMRTFDEHGCTKFGNSVQLDFFGIAMCQIALDLGLSFQVDSPYYPLVCMRPWSQA